MLLILAVVFAVLWALGYFAFHVASGAVHLLLLVAAVGLVLHFVRGRGGLHRQTL
jgi:hypothetical protein